MKVLIVGVGNLGSQVAWQILREFEPQYIILKDIKDLTGDVLDLRHAAKGLRIESYIGTDSEISYYDYVILCAGRARVNRKDDLSSNLKLYRDIIIPDIKDNIDLDTKIIVMTNPVKKLTEIIEKVFPNNYVNNPEEELMEMRDNKELGWQIVKTKGYSNFGPAVSCVRLIKKLEENYDISS